MRAEAEGGPVGEPGARDGPGGEIGSEGETDAFGAIRGEDGLLRCRWGASSPLYVQYHDTEWGLPVRGEIPLFERLSLEGFQAGLSWLTILRKRDAFREAFEGFDPERVANFADADVDRLLTNAGIVRHRGKIEAARRNAQAVLALREKGGLDAFLWEHQPDRTPSPRTHSEVPSRSAESTALSRALREAGFTFVGPTICQALMEAVGMVDTHLMACHRRGASGLWGPDGRR